MTHDHGLLFLPADSPADSHRSIHKLSFPIAPAVAAVGKVPFTMRVTVLALFLAAPFAAQSVPPTVQIVSPAPGATICGSIAVSAAASDLVGVAGVQFKYDGNDFDREATAPPYTATAYTHDVANGSYTLTAVARNVMGEQTTSAPVPITVANTTPYSPCKFIPTFLVYYGGGPDLVPTDDKKLGKFDLLDTDRFRYNQIGGNFSSCKTSLQYSNTWGAVRICNPDTQIYLYEMGSEDVNFQDDNSPIDRNTIARHGDLFANHFDYFLLDSYPSGNRIYNVDYSFPNNQRKMGEFSYLMDFGSSGYQSYWAGAVQADIANQLWVADGVHADNCLTLSMFAPYTAIPPQYSSDASWSSAMNAFASAITGGLHGFGQKLWCNRGFTGFQNGASAWRALDTGPNPPDVVGEEGAFAVSFGSSDTQFFPEDQWLLQVQTMGQIHNSKIALFSHTKLPEGGTGLDNYCDPNGLGCQPVDFWQTLWYALGSFLLGKNDLLNNAYLQFAGDNNNYDKIWWYAEYDMIHLGKALGSFGLTTIRNGNGDDVHVYSREFEKGYVYVNPDSHYPPRSVSVTLPQTCTCRQLTHETLNTPPSQLQVVTAISLQAHHAAIVLKN